MSFLTAAHHWIGSDRWAALSPASPPAPPLVKIIASFPSSTTRSQWPPSSPKSPSNQCPIRCKHVHTRTRSYLLIRSLLPAMAIKESASSSAFFITGMSMVLWGKSSVFFRLHYYLKTARLFFYLFNFSVKLNRQEVILSRRWCEFQVESGLIKHGRCHYTISSKIKFILDVS